MRLFREESLAIFALLAVLVVGAVIVGYIRSPQVFLPAGDFAEGDLITVRVAGAVERPGDHRIRKGTTVGEAARVVGLRPDASLRHIDLVRKLVDCDLIYVPCVGEDVADIERKRETALKKMRRPAQMRRIDINSATGAELETIPGIGRRTADAIMVERSRAPFRSPDEIKRVAGIGEKKYKMFKDYITVGVE
jgi:competence protein ComEA